MTAFILILVFAGFPPAMQEFSSEARCQAALADIKAARKLLKANNQMQPVELRDQSAAIPYSFCIAK